MTIGGCSDNAAAPENTPTPIANAAPNEASQTPGVVQPKPVAAAIPQGSGFDFYVLALSWSPAYCTLKGRQADRAQCNAAKPFRFIVHGLWPQFERGFPDSCATGGYPSREQIRSISDLTPSPGLVRHEWEKHGTCSGLSPDDYFAVMRAAAARVIIPAQFETGQLFALSPQAVEGAFIRANPGLANGGITTSCDDGQLTEVRLCLTKSMEFRTCTEVDGKSCRANSVSVPPAR